LPALPEPERPDAAEPAAQGRPVRRPPEAALQAWGPAAVLVAQVVQLALRPVPAEPAAEP